MSKSVSTVNAIMPVKSNDKNENWALIWCKEVDTDKGGKIDSFYLQETWRFNKDGKANLFTSSVQRQLLLGNKFVYSRILFLFG